MNTTKRVQLLSLFLLLAGLAMSGATGPAAAKASPASEARCPPKLPLGTPGGVEVQCPGHHPINCLKRPHGDPLVAASCGFPTFGGYRKFAAWNCSIFMEKACFPVDCPVNVAIDMSLETAMFEIREKSFEVSLPVPTPADAILSVQARSNVLLALSNLEKASTLNIQATCGSTMKSKSSEHFRALLKHQSSSKLSISIGSNILFRVKELDQVRRYGDLVERAFAANLGRTDGFAKTKKVTFRFSFGKGVVKALRTSLAFSQSGDLSLRISL